MPNITISDLPPVALPIDAPTTFLEVSVLAAGEEVSRRISANDLQTAIGLDASFVTVGLNAALPNERVLTGGTNISVVDAGAGATITINLDAAITGVSVNGVTLDVTGVATNFLDETGAYSVPPSQNPFATPLGILGDINLPSPPLDAITSLLEFRDLADAVVAGHVGMAGQFGRLELSNFIEGRNLRLTTAEGGASNDDAGKIEIFAGAGETPSGNGGDLDFFAGAAGSGGTGSGGDIQLRAGASGSAGTLFGGDVDLIAGQGGQGGLGGTGGNIQFSAGAGGGSDSNGGEIRSTAGGGSRDGGNIILIAGIGGTTRGGNIDITSGQSGGVALPSGDIILEVNDVTGGASGNVFINTRTGAGATGGSVLSSQSPGLVSIYGVGFNGAGNGANVEIWGGLATGGATGDGGDVQITGGQSDATNGAGGDVLLAGGAGSGSGADGLVRVTGGFIFDASVVAFASLNIPEGVAPSSPNDGDVWVTAAGGFFARLNGVSVDLAGVASITFDLLTDINTATPPTTENVTGNFRILDAQNVNLLTTIGYNATEDFLIKNFMRGGECRIEVTDTAGVVFRVFEANPVSATTILGDRTVQLEAGGRTFLVADGFSSPFELNLFHDNILTAQTAARADGGMELINNYNDAAGAVFVRVLTANDISIGLNAVRYEFSAGIGGAPSSGVFNFNNATPASVTEIRMNDDGEDIIDNSWLFPELADGDLLTFRSETQNGDLIIFTVTGVAVDNTGDWSIPVSHVSGGLPTTNALQRITWQQLSKAAGTVTIPIILLDDEQIRFGTGADITMDWDGVDFEVEGLAASQIWNWRDGLRHRWYDPTDTEFVEIEPVSATVFNFNVSNSSAGMIFNGANFWRFFDGSVQCEAGLVVNGAIAGSITFEVAGVERMELIAGDTSALLVLIQSSGDIFTIRNGINAMWSIQETGGMTIFEDGPATTDSININHDGTDGNLTLVNALDFNITGASVGYKFDESIYIGEKASANADFAAFGQFWVRTETPNLPMFTDDAGSDQVIDPSISEINVQDGNYTLLITDKGKTISKEAGGAGETYTIPANASVAFKIGTFIGFNNDGGGTLSIAITTDTLVFADDNTTGTRTLADGGMAVAQKVAATTWKIAGAGLS